MLHTGRAVVVEILLDLAAAAAVGGLVDRHHDPVAVPHDGRLQRRELGRDLVGTEVGEAPEPEHALVELDPGRELAPPDVADDMVDAGEPDCGPVVGERGRRLETGSEETAVRVALDERVHRVAVGRDLGRHEPAVGAVEGSRRAHRHRRATSASYAARQSSTRNAIERTPSPWRSTWRATSETPSSPLETTNRMSPCASTYETVSEEPVSGPA